MFLSKYGVARHIYIPIPKAGSANHAVSGDWTPAAGDVKISKDGGAAANVTNLPTAIAMGNSTVWDFSLTATEMQAAQIVVTVADSATKAVDDTGFIIETYGHASGQHEFDLDSTGLAKAQNAIGYGTVGSSASTTSIPTSAMTPAGSVADQFKGRVLTFANDTTTAALRGQATDITASTNAATPTFTVTALTTAPASGDTFVIT